MADGASMACGGCAGGRQYSCSTLCTASDITSSIQVQAAATDAPKWKARNLLFINELRQRCVREEIALRQNLRGGRKEYRVERQLPVVSLRKPLPCGYSELPGEV